VRGASDVITDNAPPARCLTQLECVSFLFLSRCWGSFICVQNDLEVQHKNVNGEMHLRHTFLTVPLRVYDHLTKDDIPDILL
jgi:hypothetical protein